VTLEQELETVLDWIRNTKNTPENQEQIKSNGVRLLQILEEMGEERANRYMNEMMQGVLRTAEINELPVKITYPDGTVDEKTFHRTDG
jgi:hypothetical protein